MNIRRMNPAIESETATNIAHAYRQVFGQHPWNEGFLCHSCNRNFPIDYVQKDCDACLSHYRIVVPLMEYWPEAKVIGEFHREMRNPCATCLVAEEDREVIGFAWGYLTSRHDAVLQLKSPGLIEKIDPRVFFYVDEVAVLPAHQQKGIGTSLMKHLLAGRPEQGLLRTMTTSPMHHLAKNLGWAVIFRYDENPEKVIMHNASLA